MGIALPSQQLLEAISAVLLTTLHLPSTACQMPAEV